MCCINTQHDDERDCLNSDENIIEDRSIWRDLLWWNLFVIFMVFAIHLSDYFEWLLLFLLVIMLD